MSFENSLSFARLLDTQDPLRGFRERFLIPKHHQKELIYFVGNSLGLQPSSTHQYLENELAKWQNWGVESWFQGDDPWIQYLKHLKNPLAKVLGARPDEVTVMNSLTVNLHLMMASFYRSEGNRFKILTEGGAFPSDQYAFETHLTLRGFNPNEALLEVFPREGEHTLRTEDILQIIEREGESLALVLMGGINYYSGQVFDMQAITQKAHQVGALAGFDLAHATGNILLQLHDWEIDFAVWCSYKYLNSGPGGVSGVFVHQNHHTTASPRLAGWWGYDEATRFEMTKGFKPMTGADGWQISTPPMLLLACHRASLEIFEAAGMQSLRQKSEQLTDFLTFVIEASGVDFEIITPKNKPERGCQLSLLVQKEGKKLFDHLVANGVLGDWREPNVIRLAPVPLYNTFEEVWRVGQAFLTFND